MIPNWRINNGSRIPVFPCAPIGETHRERCLSAATRSVAALEAHLHQQLFRRAEAGEAALEKVEADKGGEGEEPLRDEDRAAVDAEGEGKQDEKARHDADDAVDGHD